MLFDKNFSLTFQINQKHKSYFAEYIIAKSFKRRLIINLFQLRNPFALFGNSGKFIIVSTFHIIPYLVCKFIWNFDEKIDFDIIPSIFFVFVIYHTNQLRNWAIKLITTASADSKIGRSNSQSHEKTLLHLCMFFPSLSLSVFPSFYWIGNIIWKKNFPLRHQSRNVWLISCIVSFSIAIDWWWVIKWYCLKTEVKMFWHSPN